MKTYNSIDRNAAKTIRAELDELLKKFAEARGLEYVSAGNATFSSTDVVFKGVTFKVAGEKSHNEKQKDADLRFALNAFNLAETNSFGWQIVEYRSRSHKYPVIYRKNNQLFKTSLEEAKRLFSKAS